MKIVYVAAFLLPVLASAADPTPGVGHAILVRPVKVHAVISKAVYTKSDDGSTGWARGDVIGTVDGTANVYDVRPFQKGYYPPDNTLVAKCDGTLNGDSVTVSLDTSVYLDTLEGNDVKEAFSYIQTASKDAAHPVAYSDMSGLSATENLNEASLVIVPVNTVQVPEGAKRFEQLQAFVQVTDSIQ